MNYCLLFGVCEDFPHRGLLWTKDEEIGLVRVITTCEKIELAGIVDEDQNSVNKYSESDGTKCLASEQSPTFFREVFFSEFTWQKRARDDDGSHDCYHFPLNIGVQRPVVYRPKLCL